VQERLESKPKGETSMKLTTTFPRRWMAVVAIVAAAGLTAGLIGSAAAAGRAAKKTYLFISIAKSLDNPAFAVAQKGAKVRIAEIEKRNPGVKIKLEWTAPQNGNEAQEVEMIGSDVARRPDGLLINSLGPAVCQAVNDAVKAGIPVVMWDSDCPGSKRTAYVGSDNYLGGVMAGKLFANYVKGKGLQKIAILITAPGAFNIGQRADGFIKGIKDAHVNYKLISKPQGDDDIAKSVDAVETTLRGNPDINAFYFAQPLPLLASGNQLPLLTQRAKSGKLTVISFDTVEPELKWVANGTVIALVGQRYYDWGYEGLTVMANIAAFHSKYKDFVNTGLDIVTPKGGKGLWTPAQFESKWKHFSFSDKPIAPLSGGSFK
jgi:ribose transport system substrate-binding protein